MRRLVSRSSASAPGGLPRGRLEVPSAAAGMTDLAQLIGHWGYIAIFVVVVLGNVGLPLPEETILALAGYLVWRGELSLSAVLAVAKAIGQPSATRAVARACATNPVAIAIPCHRVVREDGKLGGYRWGIERKRQLLEREASH